MDSTPPWVEVEGILPHRLREIVACMAGTKSTLPSLKKIIKDLTKAQMWTWHLLHPQAVTDGLVHESSGMLVSNMALHSNNLIDLGEVSATFCSIHRIFENNPLFLFFFYGYIGYHENGEKGVWAHLRVACGSRS